MHSKKSNTFLSDYCIDSRKYNYLEIKMYSPIEQKFEHSFTEEEEKKIPLKRVGI